VIMKAKLGDRLDRPGRAICWNPVDRAAPDAKPRGSPPRRVGRRSSIWKKSGLFPPGDGVDDCGVVGAGRFAGKRVDAGNIVEPAINAPDVTGNREALECFVNG